MKRLLLILAMVILASCGKNIKPSYIVQVSLGGWDSPQYSAAEIISRLDSVSAHIPINTIIIGWSKDKDIYREVGSWLHQKGIRMFLWLPVFAETEEVCENTPALDLWGDEPASFDLTAGEGFRFNCPSNPENAAHIVSIYDSLFADCPFDGVFLDRIRTQSFVGGIGGVLGCGCPVCTTRFREQGIDLADVRRAWEADGDAFLSVSGYTPAGGFSFVNPLADAFFKAKGTVVSTAVAGIADSLRSRGLGIGMDLYAPFMATFVGQDYEILSRHADFIKPMLYRKTNAPAGMGFEYDLLKKTVPGATGYPEFRMDVEFLESQLEAMAPYPCHKYPGLEINYREGIALTTPRYVTESIDAIMKYGFEGAVLSWNIMEAPEAHILCLK